MTEDGLFFTAFLLLVILFVVVGELDYQFELSAIKQNTAVENNNKGEMEHGSQAFKIL